ncbi:hypothetical protein B0H21DRAFT_733432 [Amylocystis lapponica]|nr:hypothetical protein B0H21DRAFT_733432 [Amylocystis lapponica]
MKRLFGREKGKAKGPADIATGVPPENHSHNPHLFHHHDRPQSATTHSSDDHWSMVDADTQSSVPRSSLTAYSPSATTYLSAPRPSSPVNSTPSSPQPTLRSHSGKDRDREQQVLRKKAPGAGNALAAVGILRALEPHPGPHPEPLNAPDPSEDSMTEVSCREEKKERRGFWERTGVRDKERDRFKEKERKDEDPHAELTRMIGYLTATASEDWSLVLEVCERASTSEPNAKEAVKALRREFKYAEPSAQLSAARLWAIMLRNCSEVFIWQCASRKFLDTLEDVITSSRTSPVVRERLLEVLAAAAFASTSSRESGFRHLWRRVKPADKPDEGIPFDTGDAMFYPPAPRPPPSQNTPTSEQPFQVASPRPTVLRTKSKSSSQNRVIPLEEDIRRLFQECKVGRGNAALLSEALAFAKPEDLKLKDIIREFYARCRASQELISAQIPWAFAGAERSRQTAGRGDQQRKEMRPAPEQNRTSATTVNGNAEHAADMTTEEQLLAALLAANEDLMEALRVYDDLERVGIERDAQERSKKETRIDRSQLRYDETDNTMYLEPGHAYQGGASSSRSASPSLSASPAPSFVITPVVPSHTHPLPPIPTHGSANSAQQHSASVPQSLAPPPPAPVGPRSPAHGVSRSRTPSPELSGPQNDDWLDIEDEVRTPGRPSAKALGKRRVIENPDIDRGFDPDDIFYEHTDQSLRPTEDALDSDSEDGRRNGAMHHPTHYVYDAAAERMQQRIKEGRLAAAALVSGVY